MTSLTIHLNSASDHFSVVKTENNSTSTRTQHPIADFEQLLGVQLQAPSVSTGLMPSSLILTDETDTHKTFIFYYPEIKYTLNAATNWSSSISENNPDIFIKSRFVDEDEDGDEYDYSYLTVPDITARNVCLVIRQEKQNDSVDYTVGVLTNMLGNRTTKQTQLICPWGNNFGQSICWHQEFNHNRLLSKDPFNLETITYAYLNSIFNEDLSVDGGRIEYPREFLESPYGAISQSYIIRHAMYMHWSNITNHHSPYDTLTENDILSFSKCYSFDALTKGSFNLLHG